MDRSKLQGHSCQGLELAIDGFTASELAAEFGTPLFIYSGSMMASACTRIRHAFAERVKIFYAVKANGIGALLRFFSDQGCGFDVVSGGEIERLNAAGLEQSEFVFSGVGKQQWEVESAMARDGLLFINLESLAEMEMLEQVGRRLGRPVKIALRLNLEIAASPHAYLSTSVGREKFGLAPEQALIAARRALASTWLEPVGLHLHLGSLVSETGPYLEAARRALAFAQEAGLQIRFLDMGGGFAVPLNGEEGSFPFKQLATELAELLAGVEAQVVVEPGRFLVGPAGVMLTRVIRVKESGGSRFVIVDGAMNDFIRPSLYGGEHLVWPVGAGPRPTRGIPVGRAQVVGPVCESGDFLARDRELPPVAGGDLLALFCAGAYGSAMASHYNSRRLPAQVLVQPGKKQLIRKRDDFSDLWKGEI